MSLEAIRNLGRPIYMPIELPEFKDEAVCQPCVGRWDMMKPHLPAVGSVVDYGCHTGWMTRQFARNGWGATGVDKSKDYISIARYIEKVVRTGASFISGDMLEMTLDSDVALCLSSAMYLFDDVGSGWKFFRLVSERSPILFMDFGGMYSGRLPFNEGNVSDQMAEYTEYKKATMIGHTDFESRPFFKFERS